MITNTATAKATKVVYSPAVVVKTTPSDTSFFNNKLLLVSLVPAT